MIKKTTLAFLTVWLYCLSVLFCPARSETKAPAPSQEMETAIKNLEASQQVGPATIQLGEQAILKLPKNYVFIPNPAAKAFLKAMGNNASDNLQGLIFADEGKGNWVGVIQYISSGYIKDDEAKTWNTDELLNNYRKGTEESNQERIQKGFPALEVTGWVEKPAYEANTHRLVWSMSVKNKGDTSDKQSVNYNTFALGREGYLSLNLVTDIKSIEAIKPRAHELLSSLQFNNGKSYADFNKSTDKVAEYGLAALVGGLAAKKLGLLALGAALFAKFAKLIIGGGILFLAGIRRIFKKKSEKA